MKTYKSTGRHQGEVLEDGKVIERAFGRTAIFAMKEKHGINCDRKTQSNEVKPAIIAVELKH